MTSNESVLADFDVHTPSPARMYNFYLGGKDNFEADCGPSARAESSTTSSRPRTAKSRCRIGRSSGRRI
jgi:hypothetical protein